jgi:hypothetical protein
MSWVAEVPVGNFGKFLEIQTKFRPSGKKNSTKFAAKSVTKAAPVGTFAAALADASAPQFKVESDQRKKRLRLKLPDRMARYWDGKKHAAIINGAKAKARQNAMSDPRMSAPRAPMRNPIGSLSPRPASRVQGGFPSGLCHQG